MTNVPPSTTGKRLGDQVYFHLTALSSLSPPQQSALETAVQLSKLRFDIDFNVVKLGDDLRSISLLDYESFFEVGFPSLRQSWSVDLSTNTIRHRSYADSLNPPILHRKELLLPVDHDVRAGFAALTAAAEQVGLFDDPVRIGFRQSWEQLVAQRGYRVVGHELLPIGNEEVCAESDPRPWSGAIERHLTALTRYSFSAPVQCLGRHGFLDGSRTVFDYGCGRGDDLRGLRDSGITAAGWDPHYAPQQPRGEADIVNLGFVINVIEDPAERVEALRAAYALARQLLVVAVMVRSEASVSGLAYGDGVVTSRNTFQKYFTQPELKHYLQEALGEAPLPVAPGIMYVFKDKDAEQRFLYGQLESRRNLLRLEARARPPKATVADRALAVFDQHRPLLDSLWRTWLALGRMPDPEEITALSDIITAVGSLSTAYKLIGMAHAETQELVEQARASRSDDLRVYMARLRFDRSRSYRSLEPRLQRDVRAFFGGFKGAQEAGRQLLESLSDVPLIDEACRKAADSGLGHYSPGESLQLHMSLVERLPASLRAYVECGAVLYGDLTAFDLVKIHVRSSKLTLMRFDDFARRALPKLQQRIKLNLRTQDIESFNYGAEHEPTYLYEKSKYINEEFPQYAEQLALEEALDRIGLLRFRGYGPPATAFDAALRWRRYRVDGLNLTRSDSIPPLSERCGRFLTYGHFVECGETWNRLKVANAPREAATYSALADLAFNILDPVIDYFGMIRLNFGFCSSTLAREIPGRISPGLDQHAAHESKRGGKPICDRLGAACDFIVDDEDMEEVALWIASNTPFDRLYFYGKRRPIHVSYGPDHSRQFVDMQVSDSGKQYPRMRKGIEVLPSYAALKSEATGA